MKQKNAKKQQDEFDEHAWQYKNEAEFQEEIEAEGLTVKEVEEKHFEEDDSEEFSAD